MTRFSYAVIGRTRNPKVLGGNLPRRVSTTAATMLCCERCRLLGRRLAAHMAARSLTQESH